MTSITLLLVVATHASMATAGLAVAGYTIGQAVTGPPRGRLADRHGLARVCALLGGAYAIAFALLTAGAMARWPAGALIAAATVTGIVVPPLSPGMRSLWSAHATAAKAAGVRQAAFALDAAVFDLTALTGPVVASALATGADPAAGTGVLLALTGAAIVIIGLRARSAGKTPAAAGNRSARHEAGRVRRLVPGPLRSAAMRRLLVTGFLVNAALSVTEVALTAYARQHHAVWASGPLLAEVSAGSIVGSLLLGARAGAGTGAGRLRRLLAGYAVGLAVLAAAAALSGAPFWGAPHSGILTSAGSYPLLIAIAAPVAGVWLGPSLATLFGLASRSAPGGDTEAPGGGTEAQGWLNSMMNGGASAGAALAGAASGRPALSLGLAALAAALAAVVTAAGAFRSDGSGTGPRGPRRPRDSRGSRGSLEMFSSGNAGPTEGLCDNSKKR
jgi:MFS family permease